ncbi:glutamate racemase [Ramlibacter sp. PS4R-6]|uniref:glutamate racemase n=1 Tax=Ramlibacter sp. PS4R-6 TaxID=3133438 RepID=UPI0030B2409C
MIGVFDSGIGGHSVLRALRAQLPDEPFAYFADTEHAPYGERDEAFVAQRSLAITRKFIEEDGANLVVVACNTATAAAIHLLREAYPQIPFVGVEPPLRPAVAVTRTRQVGVMATRGTLASAKFRALHESLAASGVRFILQPCDGLALAIETNDAARVRELCERYVGAVQAQGDVDTLVLGCTHYALVDDVLQAAAGDGVRLVEPGVPVARRVAALLA